MSDPVEDELRALLQSRASRVADARDPVAGVEAGVRRVVVRRRLAVTAGVPVLVGAVVGGAGLLSGQPGHDTSGAVAVPAPSATAAAFTPVPVEPLPASSGPVTVTPAPLASSAVVPAENPQVEVFRTYLENQPAGAVVSATPYGGRAYCSLRVLDQSARFVDLAAFCQVYYLKDGLLTKGPGSNVPVRLAYTGLGADTHVTGIAVPQMSHGMAVDLQKLFTPLGYSRWLQFFDGELGGPGLDQSASVLLARAKQDVVTRRLEPGLNPAS